MCPAPVSDSVVAPVRVIDDVIAPGLIAAPPQLVVEKQPFDDGVPFLGRGSRTMTGPGIKMTEEIMVSIIKQFPFMTGRRGATLASSAMNQNNTPALFTSVRPSNEPMTVLSFVFTSLKQNLEITIDHNLVDNQKINFTRNIGTESMAVTPILSREQQQSPSQYVIALTDSDMHLWIGIVDIAAQKFIEPMRKIPGAAGVRVALDYRDGLVYMAIVNNVNDVWVNTWSTSTKNFSDNGWRRLVGHNNVVGIFTRAEFLVENELLKVRMFGKNGLLHIVRFDGGSGATTTPITDSTEIILARTIGGTITRTHENVIPTVGRIYGGTFGEHTSRL